jgi:hypothetical protein
LLEREAENNEERLRSTLILGPLTVTL